MRGCPLGDELAAAAVSTGVLHGRVVRVLRSGPPHHHLALHSCAHDPPRVSERTKTTKRRLGLLWGGGLPVSERRSCSGAWDATLAEADRHATNRATNANIEPRVAIFIPAWADVQLLREQRPERASEGLVSATFFSAFCGQPGASDGEFIPVHRGRLLKGEQRGARPRYRCALPILPSLPVNHSHSHHTFPTRFCHPRIRPQPRPGPSRLLTRPRHRPQRHCSRSVRTERKVILSSFPCLFYYFIILLFYFTVGFA